MSNSDEYDVFLELMWKQHSDPYTEYFHLANIQDGHMVGNIVDVKKKKKPHIKDILFLSRILLLMIIILYGVPFYIIYHITERLYVSLGLAALPIAILTMIFYFDKHIEAHRTNIVLLFKEMDRHTTSFRNKQI